MTADANCRIEQKLVLNTYISKCNYIIYMYLPWLMLNSAKGQATQEFL